MINRFRLFHILRTWFGFFVRRLTYSTSIHLICLSRSTWCDSHSWFLVIFFFFVFFLCIRMVAQRNDNAFDMLNSQSSFANIYASHWSMIPMNCPWTWEPFEKCTKSYENNLIPLMSKLHLSIDWIFFLSLLPNRNVLHWINHLWFWMHSKIYFNGSHLQRAIWLWSVKF